MVIFGAGSPCAHATLRYDLRVVGGGAAADVSTNGQVINLELFAVVTGAAGDAAMEGFQDGYVTILSSNGGNIRGNISGTLTGTFSAQSSSPGLAQDLDGDGDKDLGSLNTSPSAVFLFARSDTITTSGVAIAGGLEFKLADLTFTVTGVTDFNSLAPISLTPVVIDFSRSLDLEAVWMEDGQGSSGTLNPGGTFPNSVPPAAAAVTLQAVAAPGAAALLLCGMAALAARRRRRSSPACAC
jgi:hypothetical protein